MIGLGLYHLVKPVHCTSCDHYFAGATLSKSMKHEPRCPSCGATDIKIANWDDLVILPKASLADPDHG